MPNSNIREILRLIVAEEKVFSKTCKVLSVDGNFCDVEPIDGSADILDVTLSPTGTGVRLKPTIGSFVQVTFISDTEAYISAFSEVDKIEVDCNDIVFNGGNNDGLVLIQQLVTKLNNLENKVNTIITWGATVTPPLATPPLMPTTQSEIEDTKIKH